MRNGFIRSDEPTNSHIDATIIIPTKNEENNIGICLDAIFKQETSCSFELIIIDSGSTDKTLSIIREYEGIRLIEIKPEDFGHGKTRNMGGKLAKGKYIVFLNADAVPVDSHWLDTLLEPFANDPGQKIAGVYSRHLPKESCDLYMARDILKSMPAERFTRTHVRSLDFMIFSTVSCAVRRDTWIDSPFHDEIPIAEDQHWAAKIIEKGFQIIYEPASTVYHSHNYSPNQMYLIKYNVGTATCPFKTKPRAVILGFILSLGGTVIKLAGDFLFIFFKSKSIKPLSLPGKFKEFFKAIRLRSAGAIGKYKGWIRCREFRPKEQ